MSEKFWLGWILAGIPRWEHGEETVNPWPDFHAETPCSAASVCRRGHAHQLQCGRAPRRPGQAPLTPPRHGKYLLAQQRVDLAARVTRQGTVAIQPHVRVPMPERGPRLALPLVGQRQVVMRVGV